MPASQAVKIKMTESEEDPLHLLRAQFVDMRAQLVARLAREITVVEQRCRRARRCRGRDRPRPLRS
jgi:hypothetical protein